MENYSKEIKKIIRDNIPREAQIRVELLKGFIPFQEDLMKEIENESIFFPGFSDLESKYGVIFEVPYKDNAKSRKIPMEDIKIFPANRYMPISLDWQDQHEVPDRDFVFLKVRRDAPKEESARIFKKIMTFIKPEDSDIPPIRITNKKSKKGTSKMEAITILNKYYYSKNTLEEIWDFFNGIVYSKTGKKVGLTGNDKRDIQNKIVHLSFFIDPHKRFLPLLRGLPI